VPAGAADLREVLVRLGLLIDSSSGEKSSSPSSWARVVLAISSSSSESITVVRLVAARREGREGEAADMVRGSGQVLQVRKEQTSLSLFMECRRRRGGWT
jgi:hypothetical protein